MATQIKSTPTLYGKDALVFEANAEKNINNKTPKNEVLKHLEMFKSVINNSKNIL